ncbi:hypothetical protein ACWEQ7_30375 [Streptomyces sp. NPDC004069]
MSTLKDRLYGELARILSTSEASIVLDTIRFPKDRVNITTTTPQGLWKVVQQKLEAGVLLDGETLLIRTVSEWYPANPVLREALEVVENNGGLDAPTEPRPHPVPPQPDSPDEAVGESGAPGPQPEAPDEAPSAPCTTLVFIADSHHGEFIRGAWEEDSKSALLYVSADDEAAVGQVAVLLSQPLPQARVDALRQRLIGAGAPADLEILQQDCGHRPYLLQLVRAFGPDQQPFDLSGVPSTTAVSDIASAVLARYDTGPIRDRLRRRRRTVVDRRRPDGSFQRLDPSLSLHDSGVRDGDTLNIYPESTAGVSQLRIQAVLRVRREIFRYADEHQEFWVDRVDDPDFPTEYDIRFRTPGFRPPDDAAPDALPQPQAEHSALILLGPKFPLEAPAVIWLSPVFHPNIISEPKGDIPEGLVCLGPLDASYRPTLDFGQLCQMLVDMAGYRNYDVRYQRDGGGGWFNDRAARWAASEEGAAMIAAIGGTPSAEGVPESDSPAARALRLRKSDVVSDDS